MKNHEIEPQEEEIKNLEQFQVGRSQEKSSDNEEKEQDDSEYTEDEIEFADGEGTQLAEAFEDDDEEDIDEETE